MGLYEARRGDLPRSRAFTLRAAEVLGAFAHREDVPARADALAALAQAELLRGEFDAARERLDVLADETSASAFVQAKVSLLRAVVSEVSDSEDPSLTDSALERARALAARHGFLGIELQALVRQAQRMATGASSGEPAAADELARTIARRVPPNAQGIGDGIALLSSLAKTFHALGSSPEAAEWRSRARALAEARLADAPTDEARARLATTRSFREALEANSNLG